MKKYFLLLAIIVFTLLQSCSDESNPPAGIDGSFRYPLKPANTWSYSVFTVFSNINPDSIMYLVNNQNTTADVTVIKDTVLNSIPVYELYEKVADYSTGATAYYENSEQGLIRHGHRGAGISIIMPKQKPVYGFIFHGEHFRSIHELVNNYVQRVNLSKQEDDSIYLSDSRIVYKYPLETGQEWAYNNGYPKANKKVEAKETVTTATGVYECFKIRLMYDLNNDGIPDEDFLYYEYIGAKGLIKVEIFLENISISSPESPDGIGEADVKLQKMLTGVNF